MGLEMTGRGRLCVFLTGLVEGWVCQVFGVGFTGEIGLLKVALGASFPYGPAE